MIPATEGVSLPIEKCKVSQKEENEDAMQSLLTKNKGMMHTTEEVKIKHPLDRKLLVIVEQRLGSF